MFSYTIMIVNSVTRPKYNYLGELGLHGQGHFSPYHKHLLSEVLCIKILSRKIIIILFECARMPFFRHSYNVNVQASTLSSTDGVDWTTITPFYILSDLYFVNLSF